MSELSNDASRRDRFLEEQAAAWADVRTLLQAIRDAYTQKPEAPVGSGPVREGMQRVGEIGRSFYLNVFERYERCQPIRRSLSAIEQLDSVLDLDTALKRARFDGSMQLLLARACLRLRDPWILYFSTQQKGGNRKTPAEAGEWSSWMDAQEKDSQAVERLLASYRSFFAKCLPEAPSSASSRSRMERYRRNLAFWWRRQRAVAATLKAEACIVQMILTSFEVTCRTLDELCAERDDLRQALRGRVDYIRLWSGGDYEPPDADARLVSLNERLDVWQMRVDKAVDAQLPEKVETTDPRGPLPSILNSWRMIEPRKAYRKALRLSARPVLASGLSAAIEQNLAITQDMERANDVILYARGAAREAGAGILSEALENAKTLLEQRDRTTPATLESLENSVQSGLIAAGREAGAVLEVSRAGVLALITRRQGRRILGLTRSFLRRFFEQAAERAGTLLSGGSTAIQIKFGWKLPTRPPLPPVVHRIQLRETMDLEAATRELPALYRRLFRLSPVEDPRFLVGRDEELQGFQQALETWRAGRFAACLLVGARGSGKTSLLNCAISGLFAGECVIRAQFAERITKSGQMDDFLGTLPGMRRIVVLEELERTYLKSFDGFGAIRRLQEVIQATASSTLWILALNDFSFHLLDRAIRFGASFSHRVNAMSVLRDDLVKAILQRHNLSGLRLMFAPPPPDDPRLGSIRAFFGMREDAQRMFFDSLYEQSGGVFRSAFELWQSSISRVEAGAVEMKQPLAPDFGRLRGELDQLDHFTLLSINQHGSLEFEEVSSVLREPAENSRLRLDRLTALDIVAPDPEHSGLRVRPEAQLFVNDLLQRMNLI